MDMAILYHIMQEITSETWIKFQNTNGPICHNHPKQKSNKWNNEPNHYNRVPISYTLSTFILDLIPQRTIDPLWVYFDDRNPRPYFSDHHQIVPDVILHPQIEKGNLGK